MAKNPLHKNDTFNVHDTNRYQTDDYAINIAMQENVDKISIGMYVTNLKVGISGYQEYWHYDQNEKTKAQKTYKDLKNCIGKITGDFEYQNLPMSLLKPVIRRAVDDLDLPHKERSGVSIYNTYAIEVEKEPDWRKSLYGRRYPGQFFYPMSQPWNIDEASRTIETNNVENTRQRIIKYKYANQTKLAQFNSMIEMLKRQKWNAISTAAMISFLILFGQKGGTPEKLAEMLETNPQAVRDAIPEVPTEETSFSEPPIEPETPVEEVPQETPQIDTSNLDMRNLEGLDPSFSQKVVNILSTLQSQGWQPRVAEGLRTLEQQQQKIDQGRSSLKNPQNSKHVQGLAVDIIDRRWGWGGEAANTNHPFWNALGKAAQEEGLTWGGSWTTFKDVAHVEVAEDNSKDMRIRSKHPPESQVPPFKTPQTDFLQDKKWSLIF